MKNSKYAAVFLVVLSTTIACKTFVVKDVNYTQHVESVLIPDSDGVVTDSRYALSFNILPFQYRELNDSSSVKVTQVRLIRNQKGYYFITADSFSNVYIMEPVASGLKLKEKVKVSELGLKSPAFNLRDPFVELIDLGTSQVITLNEKGIKRENSEVKS